MIGRSNVGKSSLINAVVNRKKVARVSQTPGKTQAIHFYLINEQFHLVDLPGYGYAKVAKSMIQQWGELIRGYLDTADALRLIVLLLDARRVPAGPDLQMYEWAADAGIDQRIVLTKTDKLSNAQLLKSRATIASAMNVDPAELIATSATTRKGIDQVRREMFSRI